MNATILHKERQPVESYTPERHETEGRKALANDMRQQGIKCEHHYIVGRHAYMMVEFTNGNISRVRKLY